MSVTETGEPAGLSAKEWCQKYHLVAAINAGMYHKDRSGLVHMTIVVTVPGLSGEGYLGSSSGFFESEPGLKLGGPTARPRGGRFPVSLAANTLTARGAV